MLDLQHGRLVSLVAAQPDLQGGPRRGEGQQQRLAQLPGPPRCRHRHLQAGQQSPGRAATVPHLELSREIVRAFNYRYGPIFPEPTAVFTDAPIVLGTDGPEDGQVGGNTIPTFAEPDEILRLVMSMVTDPLRIKHGLRSAGDLQRLPASPLLRRRLPRDPGRRANRAHRVRRHQATARRTDDRILPPHAREARRWPPMWAWWRQYSAGADKVRPILEATRREVLDAVGTGRLGARKP